MGTKYGSVKDSYWKAYMVYGTSSDNDSYTVTVSAAGPYASGGWVNYPFKMSLSATGKNTTSYGTWQNSLSKGSTHDFVSSNKVYTFEKGTSAAAKTISAKVTNTYTGSSSTATLSVSVPALAKYTISYNANGGSGAPGSQTKYYGKTLKLSTTKPTRTGYTFKGWSKSSTGSVAFAAGANYTTNASDTLYAVWEANKYTITLNANGGTGGTASVTKTYGQAVTLPTSIPTKTNYNFKGWASTANATAATWSAGGSYTTNITANVTLYAVWELAYIQPQISNLVAMRMDSSGAMDDTGTYAKVRFDWKSGINGQTALVPTQIKIEMRESGTTGYATVYTNTPTATSGSIISDLIANVDTTKQYDVLVTVTDSMGYGTRSTYVSKAQYIIDVEPSGDGISFGSACSRTGLSTSWDIYMDNNKALYCGGSDKTSWYNMLGSDETNTFHFGYGSYNNNFGNTYYNGNTVNIRSKSDINIQSENSKIVLKSATNNNIVMYPKGGTIAYTLYYAAGMEFDVNVFTAGFVTNSSADVRFTFYFSRPVVNDPIITVSSQSNGGFLLRQDGKYTHGSASTPTYAKPSSYSTICTNNYVRINATFSKTTNAINNTPVGIQWLGHIAFA